MKQARPLSQQPTTYPRAGKAGVATCLTALALGIGASAQVNAQETQQSAALEEVIVTASRREESLQLTTTSIAVVTAQDLEQRGIVNFADLEETVSGLTIDQPTSAISSAVYIRGVGTAGTSGAVASVGIMIDGVYQTNSGTAFTELMDIERVEVLRGPQGTLFGKNTTAGAIRVFTASPDTSEFSGRIQGVLGDYDQAELRGIINVPLIEDKLAARVSAYNAERDGYTDNRFTGKDTRNKDREGWRAKLLWNATDDLRFLAIAQNDKRDSRMDQALAEYGSDFLAVYGDQAADFPISVGNAQENFQGSVSDDVDRYQLNVDWSFWSHTLSGIFAREEGTLNLNNDQDRTFLNGHQFSSGLSELTNTLDREVDTIEIQLASDFDASRFKYVLGYFLQQEDNSSNTQFVIPNVTLPPREPTLIKVDSEAVFGNLSFDFTDRWNASVGLRYTEDERTGSNNVVGQGHIETFDEWTYALKLRYQWTDDLMVYLSHDKGFKSGGVQREFSSCGRGGRCVAPDQAIWDPEEAFNYELGMKGEFMDNTVRFNAAVFYQTFDDFQVSQSIPGEANVIVSNAAEVEATGVEVEALALLGDHFTLNGSISYIKTEYEDYQNAPCATPTAPGCVNGVQDLSGETLDHAPEWSFNLGGEYRTGLSFADLFARADVIYRDDQQLNSIQSPFTEEGAYTLVNARIGLENPDLWRVTLWVNNATDEDYLVSAEVYSAGVSRTPGLPRMYGATLDFMF